MPFPIESAGLTIRPLDSGDIDDFVAYRRDPDTATWQSWDTSYDAAQAIELVARQQDWSFPPPGEWMQLAVLDGKGQLIGDLGLHTLGDQPDSYEVGFTLAPHARGRGHATEAVRALLGFLFDERGAHRVIATIDERNRASAAVLLRAGFHQESHRIDADWFKGEWTTVDDYAVLAGERQA